MELNESLRTAYIYDTKLYKQHISIQCVFKHFHKINLKIQIFSQYFLIENKYPFGILTFRACYQFGTNVNIFLKRTFQ